MAYTLTRCEDNQRWNDFVASSPQGNVFCSTFFLDALGEEYDLLMVYENGRPQLGAVVLKRHGQPIQAPYPFTMYQGILFASCGQNMPFHSKVRWTLDVTDFLLAQMEQRYERISFCMHYDVADLRSFQWFHYHEPTRGQVQIDLRYTGLLNLGEVFELDAYLMTLRAVRRQEYRRALGEGMIVEEAEDLAELEHLHRLTFERQGIQRTPEEERLLRAISHAALSKGFGRLAYCRTKAGIAASAVLIIYDNRSAYYLFGANDPEFRKLGSGTFLLLENIRWCAAKGLSKFDFVGINSPNRGDFKTSFNASPRPYFLVTWEKPAT